MHPPTDEVGAVQRGRTDRLPLAVAGVGIVVAIAYYVALGWIVLRLVGLFAEV